LYGELADKVPREKAVNQAAFGGNDYSVDGFHFDEERRNFYLFKYSNSHAQFKGSLQRLIENGMEQIFVSPNRDDSKNQLLLQLRTCLVENRAVIDQVCIRFVFTGDPEEAERSQVLDKLRDPEALLKELAAGKGDGEILGWVQAHSKIPRAPWEIEAWSAYMEQRGPDSDGETLAGFAEYVGQHSKTREDIKTWFDAIELDDYVSFGGKA